MGTLIIPAAGLSTRFPGMRPKWLLTHPDGKLVITKVLESTPLEFYDRIIISVLKEHEEKYNIKFILDVIARELNIKLEVCILNHRTSGPAHTVSETIEKMEVIGAITIRDCDNIVKYRPLGSNYIVGMSLNKMDLSNIKNKSYIILDSNGCVGDIIEKRVISDLICLGVYSFEDARLVVDAYNNIVARDKELNIAVGNVEVYLSHIVSSLINLNSTNFNYTSADQFEDWGTLKDWKIVLERCKTYFVDVDGVIYKNRGRYSTPNWDDPPEVLEQNIQQLKRLYDNGAQIVIVTSRPQKYRAQIEETLNLRGITPHAFVMSCNHSQRVIVNDFAPTNPYPSCVAVSLPRDGSLANYLGE